jgi:hypothetical protein
MIISKSNNAICGVEGDYSGFPRDRNLTCVYKAMYNNLKGEATGDGFYGSASAIWNQFIREAKVGHSGSPTCDCFGIRRWTCYNYKKMHQRLGT